MHKTPGVVLIGLLALCFIAVPPLNADWLPNGIAICTANGNQNEAQIVPDGSGGAVMTWEDNRRPTTDIYAQRVDAEGAVCWAADGASICATSFNQRHPQLAQDGAGGAIITWEDYGAGTSDIYAQRIDASGAIQWPETGVAICATSGNQYNPTILSDGSGGAIICWRDMRDTYNRLYAQRVSAAGAVLWTADGVLLCSASPAQYNARLATDGNHGAIVTWMDWRSASTYDIYAQRIDASGTIRWAAGGLAISTARYDQHDPQIAFDGAGGAVIAWDDHRAPSGSPPPDVYAQRVDTLGSIMWTPDGIVISGGYRNQGDPQIIADGAGGTVIVWQDLRNDNWDVYLQRCNVNGTALWGSGVAVCTAAELQDTPRLAPDGTGGAVVTWRDYRNLNNDVYAQRVDGSGAVRWTPNGVPVCDLTSDQSEARLVSDGEGGAIFVWRDYRNGFWDIYATGLTEFGTGVETIFPPAASLAQNFPNPFNPGTRVVFTLEAPSAVSLRIYDAAGRLVRVLVERDRAAGQYEEIWDGKDASGRTAASGIYFCRLGAGSFSQTRKMILLR